MTDTEVKLVIREDRHSNHRLIVVVGDIEEHTTIEDTTRAKVVSQLATLLCYLAKLEEIR